MSLHSLEGHFGESREFAVVPLTSWARALGLTAVGVAFLVAAGSDRLQQKNLAWLAYSLAAFFVVFGLGGVWRMISASGAEAALVTASQYVAPGRSDSNFTVPLAEVTRLLRYVTQSENVLMAERGGKEVLLLGPWRLVDESAFISLFERRAALCRAGIESKSELGAAEAWLEVCDQGRRCVGVAVQGKDEACAYWLVETEAEIPRALKQGYAVFVPERTHALLSASVDSRVQPMRGV